MPPLGRRCHPHGPEEQMLMKEEKRGRGEGDERKMEGPDLCFTGDTQNICLHMQRCSWEKDTQTCTHSQMQTYMQLRTCRKTHEIKPLHHRCRVQIDIKVCRVLFLVLRSSSCVLYSLISSWILFPSLSSCFYLHFVCVLCWDIKHFEINLVC